MRSSEPQATLKKSKASDCLVGFVCSALMGYSVNSSGHPVQLWAMGIGWPYCRFKASAHVSPARLP